MSFKVSCTIQELKVSYSYEKNCKNEPHILALTMNLQELVENVAKGKMNVEWKELKLSYEAVIKIELPNQDFDDEIDMLMNNVRDLIEEEKIRKEQGENIPTDKGKEIIENPLEHLSYSPSESESDETWQPSDSEEGQEKCKKSKKNPKNIKKLKRSGDDKKKEKNVRRKVICPLIGCKSTVVHLPRHMRNCHNWSAERAGKALLQYNMRKKATNPEAQAKDYHRRRRCPVDGCFSIVLRLPAHLQKVHKMAKSSTGYNDAIGKATCVSKGKHPLVRHKENKEKAHLIPAPSSPQGEPSGQYHMESSEDEHSSEELIPDEGNLPADVVNNPVLQHFSQWLASPDGGKRDMKTVKQHTCQLHKILKVVDERENVKSLLDTKLVRDTFVSVHVSSMNYEAATIKSYLMSLRHFYSFLLSDRPDGVDFNANTVHAAREKVAMWSAAYKKETSTRRWQKLETDMTNALTPANIRAFEKSAAAREAIKIIGLFLEPNNHEAVTQASYTLVRDFLFTQIFINNANRPGVLSFMTMAEFQKMREDNGDYVIAVMKHKTVHIHGPAYIVLSQNLKSWLIVFVEMMRPQIAQAPTGPVFLTWNGTPMTSGQINKGVQSVFKKAAVDVKVTSTSFRKAAVTNMHEVNPEMSGKLAGLMAHNESTAKKYYLLSEKRQDSVQASKQLMKVMREKGDEKKEKSDEEKSDEEKKESDKEGDDGEDKLLVFNRKRQPFTEKEELVLKQTFNKELLADDITLHVVRAKIQDTGVLQGMSPKRVYHKLRQLKNKPTNDLPSELPELPSDTIKEKVERMTYPKCESVVTSSLSLIPPTERSHSLFSGNELSNIRKLFVDMIRKKRPISVVGIKKICEEAKEGKELAEKYSVEQIKNRVKHERRNEQNK